MMLPDMSIFSGVGKHCVSCWWWSCNCSLVRYNNKWQRRGNLIQRHSNLDLNSAAMTTWLEIWFCLVNPSLPFKTMTRSYRDTCTCEHRGFENWYCEEIERLNDKRGVIPTTHQHAPLWPIIDLHAIGLQPNRMSSNEPYALVLLDPGDIIVDQ
jgi:hypothetical protein